MKMKHTIYREDPISGEEKEINLEVEFSYTPEEEDTDTHEDLEIDSAINLTTGEDMELTDNETIEIKVAGFKELATYVNDPEPED